MNGYPFQFISEFIFVKTDLRHSDVILIPGSYTPQLMEKAAELYHREMAPFILPSGGCNGARVEPSGVQDLSEWEFLHRIGISLGVPDEVILREDQAANTFDNARFSLKVLQKKGLFIKKAIIVCKAFHARRALLTYQTIFPAEVEFFLTPVADALGVSKDDWFLEKKKTEIVMGEVVKIGQYFEREIPGLVKKYQMRAETDDERK